MMSKRSRFFNQSIIPANALRLNKMEDAYMVKDLDYLRSQSSNSNGGINSIHAKHHVYLIRFDFIGFEFVPAFGLSRKNSRTHRKVSLESDQRTI